MNVQDIKDKPGAKAWLQWSHLLVNQICRYCKFLQKTVKYFTKSFGWNVSLMYVDMWNRSEIFRKAKISQGIKLDYNDRISKSTKFADIINFYRKLWNILQSVFGWTVSLMFVDVWNRTQLWYKFPISLKTGWKLKVKLNLVLNPVLNLKPGSESGSVWHLIQLFNFCLMSDTKILTTPVFDHPLLSPDVIILVENLDTNGKSF